MNKEFWRGKRVLVTGHTGFKGSWLCLWLHLVGARVAGYALPPPTEPSLYELAALEELVESTIADLGELSKLKALVASFRPEIVLHMAAQSVVLRSYEDPLTTYATNVLGTANVLEAVRSAGLRCTVVNVTTDKVYLNQGWVWGYRESDELGGRDPYSSSKACAELVAQSYRHSFFAPDRFDAHGVAIASVRAGNVIGGGDWTAHQLIPETVAAFAAGRGVELRHPDGIRPWQHVLDCLNGYLVVSEAVAQDPRARGAEFHEWNLGPAITEAYPVAKVVEALATHWHVPTPWTRAPGVTPHEERELRLDSSKALRLLGWKCRLPLETALAWVAEWYQGLAAGASPRELSMAQIERYARLAPSP